MAQMTATQTWTLTGLAAIALVAGVLLATGAVSSAQVVTPTPTPSPTEEEPTEDPTDDVSTPTPAPEESDADEEDDGSDDSTTEGSSSGHWCGSGANPLIFDAAAEILGMTQDELRVAKQSGQSLADIAVAQGMTVEDFSAQLEAAARADLQARLSAGEITQEQFDEISAELDEKLDEIINSTGGLHFGGRGAPEDDATDGARFRAPFESSTPSTDA